MPWAPPVTMIFSEESCMAAFLPPPPRGRLRRRGLAALGRRVAEVRGAVLGPSAADVDRAVATRAEREVGEGECGLQAGAVRDRGDAERRLPRVPQLDDIVAATSDLRVDVQARALRVDRVLHLAGDVHRGVAGRDGDRPERGADMDASA